MISIPLKKIKKIHIIINPAAGKSEPILPVINDVMTEAGIKWDVFITKKPHDASFLAREAVKQHVDAVAVYGGDGTVMETIRGMIGAGAETPLAILPGGTANVLATDLKIPRNLKEACQLLSKEAQVRTIDLGQINKSYFALRLGMGFATQMMQSADRKTKNRFGRFAYVLSSIEALKRVKEVTYHVKIDGKDYESRGVTCIVANSGSTGFTDLSLDNEIQVDDGLLDVLIVRKINVSLYAHMIATILRRKRAPNVELVQHWQGKHIEVTSTPKQNVDCDGEVLEKIPVHAKIVPAAIKIIVPAA